MSNEFNHQYMQIVYGVYKYGHEEVNQRTNNRIRADAHRQISIPIKTYIPVVGARHIYPTSAAAELAWCIIGDKNISWLQQYTKMWDKFVNENNEIDAAYGWRWQYKFGRNQIEQAIKALKKDPTNRQVVVMAWDPSIDGLGNNWTKNVPCPIGFMLNIIDNKLNLSMFLRSSDVIVGLAYDSIFYALLLVAFANELNVEYGKYTIFLNHAHIYEKHYDIAKQMIKNYDDYNCTNIPKQDMYVPQDILITGLIKDWGLRDISAHPEEYVEYIKNVTIKPKSCPTAMKVQPEIIE